MTTAATAVLDAPGLAPPRLAERFPRPYAVVDVETSGLVPYRHRVLSLAVVHVAADGRLEHRWSTLLDPGCDPGPVHIHGLTRARLAGSPTFDAVVDELIRLLDGRVFVAHNASFDWRMLAAEAVRCGRQLPVEWRLCTHLLARRLGMRDELPNLKLATLAARWGVVQRRAHDAADDAEVLATLLPHVLGLAARRTLELPLAACEQQPAGQRIEQVDGILGADGADGADGAEPAAPASQYRQFARYAYTRRPPCPYLNPGRLAPGGPLVQGMRVAFTGETTTAREQLADRATEAGLHVTGSVSRFTSLVVTPDVTSGSTKARRALLHGTPTLGEVEFVRLLGDVRPGRPEPRALSGPGSR